MTLKDNAKTMSFGDKVDMMLIALNILEIDHAIIILGY